MRFTLPVELLVRLTFPFPPTLTVTRFGMLPRREVQIRRRGAATGNG